MALVKDLWLSSQFATAMMIGIKTTDTQAIGDFVLTLPPLYSADDSQLSL